MTSSIRIGIAGWVYPDWRGSFYPKGLVQARELAHASRQLRTIEINATFYANQKPKSFLAWAGETPEDFVFSIKGNKFITDTKKLKDVEAPLATFFASGLLALGPKLGPIVWQLPKGMKFDPERLETFMRLLPRTGADASAFAATASGERGEPYTDASGVGAMRHAIEMRDPSFAHPECVALLRQYDIALVCADTTLWPYRDVTADFVYARLQGPPGGERYDEAELDAWAGQVAAWARGETGPDTQLLAEPAEARPRDAFIYFVHTDKIHAPANARALMARLGVRASADAA